MKIVESLISQGVIIKHKGTDKLGVDLNNNGALVDNELIPDTNKDGKIQVNEALDFIVNKVESMPVIEQVIEVINQNKDEYPEILERVKDIYLPQLTKRSESIKQAELGKIEQQRTEKLAELINQVTNLEKKKEEAINSFDSETAQELSDQIKDVYTEIVFTGGDSIVEGKVISLAGLDVLVTKSTPCNYVHKPAVALEYSVVNGDYNYSQLTPMQKIMLITESIYVTFDEYIYTGNIEEKNIKLNIEGSNVYIYGARLDKNENVSRIYFAKDSSVTLTNGQDATIKANEYANVTKDGLFYGSFIDHFTEPTTTKIAGKKYLTSGIEIDENGNISRISLVKDMAIEKDGIITNYSAGDTVYFND